MKTGIIFGAFDLLHAGHIHLLRECKKNCDQLIVGIQVDPSLERKGKNKPVESILERQLKLSACKYVDVIVIYEKEADISIMLEYFKPDVRFLGSDYIGDKPITDKDIIPIEYINSLLIHTEDIRRRIK